MSVTTLSDMKLSLPLFLLLSALFSSTVFSQSFETTAEYYEDAVNHISEQSNAEAEIQLKNALQIDPDHLPSHILLGIVYLEMGQAQQAEITLVKARQLGADNNLIAVPMAQAMLKLDKFSKLERYAALKNRSKKVESQLQILLSGSYLKQGRDDDAGDALLAAEKLDPDSIDPLLAQLSLSMQKTQDEKTGTLLTRLKEMAPNSPDVWMKQAQFNEYLGDLDAAFEAYEKVLAINPEFINARVARASIIQRRDEDHDRVLQELEPLVKKYEDLLNPEMIYTYVISLLKKGRIEEARELTSVAKRRLSYLGEDILNQYPSLLFLDISIAIFENDLFKAQDSANRLLLISPSNSSARVLLGQIYIEMGDAERALEALSPIYTYKRKDPQFLSLYGRTLLETGNARDAIYELNLARDLGYNKRDLYQNLALTLKSLNRADEAIKQLEQGTALYPDDVGIAVLLVQLYLENQDARSAEVVLSELRKQDKKDPRIDNFQGMLKVAENKPKEAERYFLDALKIDENYVSGMINLSRLYISQERYADAEQLLNKALEVDSSSLDVMVGLAQISDLQGDVGGAIRWFERIWPENQKAVSQAMMLIRLYRRESMFDEAVRAADLLFEKNPEQFNVLVTYVETLIEAQNPDMALEQLKSSLRYSSDFSVEELYQLAGLQMSIDDIDGAASTLARSLSVKPDFISAKVQLIRLYTTMRRYDEAHSQVDEIIELQPESNLGQALKGDVLMAEGKLDEAQAAYSEALEKKASTSLYLNLYRIESKKLGASAAIDRLKQWVDKNPGDVTARYGLGLAYIDTGDYEAAMKLHRELLELNPENPLLLNNIAWLMQIRGDAGAYEYIKSAYQQFPENPAILDTYGWILTQNNQAELGLRYLRQAMSRSSEDPSTRYHLALALNKLGRQDEALKTLQDLMKSNPEFHEKQKASELLKQLQ